MTDIEKNQKGNTLAFLREYALMEALQGKNPVAKNEDFPSDAYSDTLDKSNHNFLATRTFMRSVHPGDIRILSQTDELTYVVILPWDELNWLVVPFSHAENPATDDEALADGAARGLFQQVYQLWNARTVSKYLIMRGWTVDKLSSQERENLRKLMRFQLLGENLETQLQKRLGTPISDPNDCRLKFRSRELRNFSKLDAEDMEYISKTETFWENLSKNVPKWQQLTEERQAAAGTNSLSQLVINPQAEKISWVEVEDADSWPLEKGTALPEYLTWTLESKDVALADHDVIFLDAKDNEILGFGIVKKADNSLSILFDTPVEGPIKRALSPADIRIVLV